MTVLSVRPWEALFAGEATRSARLRLVARASDTAEVARGLETTDILLIGVETHWLEPWLLGTIRGFGTEIIGIHPIADRSGPRLLGLATLCLPEDTPAERLVDTAVALCQTPKTGGPESTWTTEPHTHR